MNEDHKIHARIRRERTLISMNEGYDYRTRTIPSGSLYKRKHKHRPQIALDWEEVNEW